MAGGFRQSRPSPPAGSQRGHKDISPILGIIGGIGAGAAGGASAGISDSTYDPKVTATTGVTPTAPAIGGANGNINVTNAPYHPGFWANLATGGRAGLETGIGQNQAFYQSQLQANAAQAELARQGLANSGLLDVAKQNGLNDQQTRELQAHIDDMKTRNMTYNNDNLDYADNTLSPLERQTASINQGNKAQNADLTNKNQQTDAYAASKAAGDNALAAKPFAENMALSPRANMGETIFSNPMGTGTSLLSAASPLGGTKTHGFNPQTMSTTDTDTTSFAPPSVKQLGPNGLPIIPIVKPSVASGISPTVSPNVPLSTFGQVSGMQPPPPMASSNPSPAISPAPTSTFQPGVVTKALQQSGAGMYQGAQGMAAQQGGLNDMLTNLIQYLYGKNMPNTNSPSPLAPQ